MHSDASAPTYGCWAPRQQGSRAHRKPLRPLPVHGVQRALPENARRARLLGADASHAAPRASCRVATPRRTSEHRQAGGASFSETLGVAALLADDARNREASTCSFLFLARIFS